MIDDIFKSRFIEEIAKIANPKDIRTRKRLRFFALLSFILALGSTIGVIGLIVEVIKNPNDVYYVHYIVIFILFGFAVTFLLTVLIFFIAYMRNAMIGISLSGLRCATDKEVAKRGDEIGADVRFHLKKRPLAAVRLVLSCRKDIERKVLDVGSVKSTTLYKKEVVLFNDIAPGEEYAYDLKLYIPEDAEPTQAILDGDNARVTWDITVYFDFKNWHTYEENLPLKVID